MSMLDSFFNKGFKGAKCKTLLKLTIPRIKLLRNRREIQIKQMRRDIAKLLETGQEATARIRVEHIIREENMMAAQEVIELFCELIAVRLPIIETQRECPLDLKEAISSVCFAAPRCADLPELQQVQMLFAAKYGREFITAATELMPDCGVNRQIIELLSIRAPSAEVKLKLLKEIAEEHELEWDPAASETEFFKPPEDLLNGPNQLVRPLPEKKHDETVYAATTEASHEKSGSDSESDFDSFGLPDVPKVSLRPTPGGETFPPPAPIAPGGETVPAHAPITPEFDGKEDILYEPRASAREEFVAPPHRSLDERKEKQFVSEACVAPWKPKSNFDVDLQDVLAAANAAAESAERAATAARSAASLAQVRINELIKKKHDRIEEEDVSNVPNIDESATTQRTPMFDHQNSNSSNDDIPKDEHESSIRHQPQRLPSMEDDPYYSYPNLFTPHSNVGSGTGTDSTDKF